MASAEATSSRRQPAPTSRRSAPASWQVKDTKLVIVESPAKARTISGFLGPWVRRGVVDRAHPRTCPTTPARCRPSTRASPGDASGVNVDDGFTPIYVVPADKKKQITKLKALLKDADELYLATDEDREGEAIAWHLLDELKPKVPVRRMVFHEITPAGDRRAAIDHPRDIDSDLVEAQEARRILDRLYGYEVSPVLWKKVMSGTSAGRVQSVAIRLVVDRERERMAFRAASYWDLEATLDAGEGKTPQTFPARLTGVDGRRVAQGRDFTSTGVSSRTDRRSSMLDEAAARRLADALRDQTFTVSLGRVEALPSIALCAVPDDDAAAGGLAQAAVRRRAHHAGGPAAVRGTASSPICGPTRSRCRRRRSARLGPRCASCTAASYLPERRGPTPARSRTRRRRTRRSGRLVSRSARRRRPV